MTISTLDIRQLRRETGAGIMDCKEALRVSSGDFKEAIKWLRKRDLLKAEKKSDRVTKEGLIASYVHGDGKIGVLVEVNLETDFSARTSDFRSFVKNLSLHIAALRPIYVEEEDIPEEIKQEQDRLCKEQALSKGKKPPQVTDKIAQGLYNKWLDEICLLRQEFVYEGAKDGQTVHEALTALITKIGENILIRRFSCFVLGEEVIKEHKKRGP